MGLSDTWHRRDWRGGDGEAGEEEDDDFTSPAKLLHFGVC